MAKRKAKRADAAPKSVPSIVQLAAAIAGTESQIGTVVTTNVQTQVKLNKLVGQEQSLRQRLAGLQREMDKYTR